MFITKKSSAAPHVPRAAWAPTLALPLLDAMVPALTALAQTAAQPAAALRLRLRPARRDHGATGRRQRRRRLRVHADPEAARAVPRSADRASPT